MTRQLPFANCVVLSNMYDRGDELEFDYVNFPLQMGTFLADLCTRF